ncbi:uncharacterized protein CELE_T27F7.12 [Caenorhabditis elegans]|uniref:Uncharacterized protein n=1 Tax=Caenorhabditis elegans TaxID=6239 RepID=G4SL58_CAEEL|nr:Uncharacterized protein CELE_T27F7.12 [Caenorhabditis elegans]CCD72095.1 Uncharacterized protein CELE_T27F7.12 [Caenorhabditis elegans]|eukprot:NP_001254095.1 Uncharacterized protein CELE_T27F7.12 [Caenorhabditis elegans]
MEIKETFELEIGRLKKDKKVLDAFTSFSNVASIEDIWPHRFFKGLIVE